MQIAPGDEERMVLTADKNGERLDVFIARRLPIARKRARALCENGLVSVNGRRARAGTMLSAGDCVAHPPVPAKVRARPEIAQTSGGPLVRFSVLYEDDFFAAVIKPSGMPTVTLRPEDPLTLADCLAAYSTQFIDASPDSREAGLVQRLDTFTSGIVLAAKTREIWEKLREMLHADELTKEYFALVHGFVAPEEQLVAVALAPAAGGKKMRAAAAGGQHKKEQGAESRISGCGSFFISADEKHSEPVSLALVKAAAVRRHQVRVHLAHIGHPLVGDALYGSPHTTCPPLAQGATAREGFFLHAARVQLRHPATGEPMDLQADSAELEELKIHLRGAEKRTDS